MKINSSRIKDVQYNTSTEVLTIEFVKGGVYKYYAVPTHVYEGLIKDSSPGCYFDKNIKLSYTYRKK